MQYSKTFSINKVGWKHNASYYPIFSFNLQPPHWVEMSLNGLGAHPITRWVCERSDKLTNVGISESKFNCGITIINYEPLTNCLLKAEDL